MLTEITRKTGIEFSEGKEFNFANPSVVINYLQKINRGREGVSPSNVRLRTDGRSLILQVANPKVKEYRVRKSFVLKLLKWFNFPINQVQRLSIETLQSILNDYLLNISSSVILKYEDDEALTITSTKYNELTDLEVIKMCENLNITYISRNDLFMRVYTKEKIITEPIPGDTCGFGLNIFNSETGFKALSVYHYMLRYICSNGAIIEIDSERSYKVHYGNKEFALQKYLQHQIDLAEERRAEIVTLIQKANQEIAERFVKDTLRKISSALNKYDLNYLQDQIKDDSTKYELFNLITDIAKYQSVDRRFYLERSAGELLRLN